MDRSEEMAKEKSEKGPTKSDFLRKALGRNPSLEWNEINRRWAKAGHPGEISNALYYQIRRKLGIRTVWEWVPKPGSGLPGAPKDEVYQLKITLLGTDPPIWRRVQVRDGVLEDLHDVIQIAMGWTNSHMHQFHVGRTIYAEPRLMEETFDELECADSTRTMLSDVLFSEKEKLIYEYDFGDSWEHAITFEKKVEPEPKVKYPHCIGGERACPPDDCGGVWGFVDFVAVMADPKHPEHRELKQWYGGKFDPEKFSVRTVNGDLNRYC
jgi:hypothetical protein